MALRTTPHPAHSPGGAPSHSFARGTLPGSPLPGGLCSPCGRSETAREGEDVVSIPAVFCSDAEEGLAGFFETCLATPATRRSTPPPTAPTHDRGWAAHGQQRAGGHRGCCRYHRDESASSGFLGVWDTCRRGGRGGRRQERSSDSRGRRRIGVRLGWMQCSVDSGGGRGGLVDRAPVRDDGTTDGTMQRR